MSDEVQVNTLPGMTFPEPSRALATSRTVSVSAKIVSWLGETVMELASGQKKAVAEPLTVPSVAVIVTVPLTSPVTRPFASTVATDSSEDSHVNATLGIRFSLASFTSATN